MENIEILQNHVQELKDRFNSCPENKRILEEDLSWESIFSGEDPEKDPLIKELTDMLLGISPSNREISIKEISKTIQKSELYRSARNDSFKMRRGSKFEKDVVGGVLKGWVNKEGGIFREKIEREEIQEFKKILADQKIPGLVPQMETGWMGSAADWMIILPTGKEIPICCSTKLWGGGGQGDRANLYSNFKKSSDNTFLAVVCEPPPPKPKNPKAAHDKLISLHILNDEVIWISELENKLNLFLIEDRKDNKQ